MKLLERAHDYITVHKTEMVDKYGPILVGPALVLALIYYGPTVIESANSLFDQGENPPIAQNNIAEFSIQMEPPHALPKIGD